MDRLTGCALGGVLGALVLTPWASASFAIGFEGFANGTEIGGGPHGGTFQPYAGLFTMTGKSLGSPSQGAAIFDSDPFGPNSGGLDLDLLVDLGNIVILQNDAFATQTSPGIYDTPNDEENGGKLRFNFVTAFEMLSIDLIDVNGNGPATLTLQDSLGRTRIYFVPMHWTNDVTVAPVGWDTLDLTTLAPQLGEGGGTATASEDPFFDALDVISLSVVFDGSAGLDNLRFIPAPSTAVGLVGGLLGLRRRRRRGQSLNSE